MPMLRVTEDYIKQLKRMEGLVNVAYKPLGEKPTELYTIGYGHYGVKYGTTIDSAGADALLRSDLGRVEEQIKSLDLPYLSTSRWCAVVDFVFNCGIRNFRKSTLYRLIKSGADDELIANEFKKWVYSGNKVLAGLKRRRSYEAGLWLKNED